MDIKFSKNKIELKKELNALDNFVIDFTSVLNRLNVKYVVVSGYVSILFGRSRTSEDIDIIVEKMNKDEFGKLWRELSKGFECIIIHELGKAYDEYLLTGHAIRFARKGTFIPNMEFKFPKVELDEWVLNERKEVSINGNKLFISPLELQISFKLFLGSEKDIEDAKYLYKLFKNEIDTQLLNNFNRKLKIEEAFNKYLR